ncbi:MAG: hypothetical protein LBQ64_00225, partial [Bacteroidales bacterium]|nr:hypothetical protein [Bacteroidales bacterium]
MAKMKEQSKDICKTDATLDEFVSSLTPKIKSMQKQQKQYLKQIEPMVREAIASKNKDEHYL